MQYLVIMKKKNTVIKTKDDEENVDINENEEFSCLNPVTSQCCTKLLPMKWNKYGNVAFGCCLLSLKSCVFQDVIFSKRS